MDVLFVDVGFGTCNIILTGSGEAIVIDAGMRSKEPLAVLNHFSVKRIRHLIVSHWHDDHVGGATGVFRAYLQNISNIWFPADPAFKETEFWKALVEERENGNLTDGQIKPLLLQQRKQTQIWGSASYDADLNIISPCFMEANLGVESGDSNSTCGILLFRRGQSFIVFAGDAVLNQWHEVFKRRKAPIVAEVLSVPHHAGIIWPTHWDANKIQIALANLYTKIVKPKVSVISAGTRPGNKHPRADVVRALTKAHSKIMCTQLTHQCTEKLEESRTLQTTLPVLAPGRSSSTPISTKSRKPNHVACTGTVVVELLPNGCNIHQLAPHQRIVDNLPRTQGKRPLCR